MTKLRPYYETVRFREVPEENMHCKTDFQIDLKTFVIFHYKLSV